jgi:hypothetical protein
VADSGVVEPPSRGTLLGLRPASTVPRGGVVPPTRPSWSTNAAYAVSTPEASAETSRATAPHEPPPVR